VQKDYSSDPQLVDHLELSMQRLQKYYKDNYLSTATIAAPSIPIPPISGAPEDFDFMARYHDEDDITLKDELEEYFKLPRESFKLCTDPIRWWFGRKSQFPNLYCLARDIFSIPGKSLLRFTRLFAHTIMM
jgi:hypothetical protein